MKRKFINALLVCGLIVTTAFSLSSCKDYDDDIDSLQEQISELSSLESSISTLETTISSLQSEISTVESELADAADADDIDALEAEIALLEASLSSAEDAISNLEAAAASYATSDELGEVSAAVTEAAADAAAAQATAEEALTAATTVSETLTTIITSLATVQANIESSVNSALYQIALLAAKAEADSVFVATLYGYDPSDEYASTLEAYDAYLQSGVLADLQSRLEEAEAILATLDSDANIEEINEQIEELAEGLDAIEEEITSLKEEILSIYGVLYKILKSLVFSPELYYQGIEAIGVNSYTYYPITLTYETADTSVDQSDDEGTASEDSTSVAPGAVASYYLNPQNATVALDSIDLYAFVVNNATYTRSITADDLVITNVAYDTDEDGNDIIGKINVTFTVNGEIDEIDDDEDSQINVIALQYSDPNNGDSIITSDFAALKKYTYTDFAINKNDNTVSDPSENHVATTAAEAIEREDSVFTYPYFTVAYNETLDLDDYINAHYNASSDCGIFGDNNDISGDLSSKNFSIEYELIGYIWETDDTVGTDSESLYGTLDGSVFSATGVEAIGRSPLVRVTLVDNNTNDQIAAVGYFVIVITDADDALVVADPSAADDGYYLACDDTEDNAFEGYVLTLDELTSEVLDVIGLTAEQFAEIYSLAINDDSVATQYILADGATIPTEAADSLYAGTITFDIDAVDDDGVSQVLYWEISYADANAAFALCEDGEYVISRYVKFEANDTVANRRDIYVEVKWDANAYMSPVLTIEDSNKVRADWHESDSRDEGYEDIHLQVGNSTDLTNYTCEYSSIVIANTFIDDLTEVFRSQLEEQGYTSLADTVTAVYYFAVTEDQYHNAEDVEVTGESGTTYEITVSDDRLAVIATATDDESVTDTIATIESSTGTITIADNDVLYDIINGISSDREDLVNMLTLTVNVDIDVCDEAYDFFTIENYVIEVKVLTPLYLGDGSTVELTLNQGTNLYETVTDIDLTDFNGYTPSDFYEYAEGQYTFYDFYEIDSIAQNTSVAITTTYASSEGTELNTDWFTITYEGVDFSTATFTNGEVDGGFGTVTLTQGSNMSRANYFEVYVPIVLYYKWGELYSIITVKVNPAN